MMPITPGKERDMKFGILFTSHPNTDASEISLRLSYFAAAVVALSLDYIGSEVSLRAA